MKEETRLTTQNLSGIGMTSQRTRDRLIERLCEHGISNIPVLDVLRRDPAAYFSR